MKAGIICPGGGLMGIDHVGKLFELLPALERNNISIGYWGAVSVGALNLAKIAEGKNATERWENLLLLKDIWMEIQRRGPECIFPLSGYAMMRGAMRHSILDGSTIRGLVDGTLLNTRGIAAEKLVSSAIPFDVFTQDTATERQEIFSISEDQRFKDNPKEALNALIASASLFPFFPEHCVFGKTYQDGEYITLKRAIEAGCDIIFVLFPYPEDTVFPTDWFSRNFPIIAKTFVKGSARIKEREKIEIEWALRIAHNIRATRALREKIKSRSFLKSRLDRDFEDAGFTYRDKRDLVIQPVYLENKPPTLLMHTFSKEKRDLTRAMENAQDTMRRILRDLHIY